MNLSDPSTWDKGQGWIKGVGVQGYPCLRETQAEKKKLNKQTKRMDDQS